MRGDLFNVLGFTKKTELPPIGLEIGDSEINAIQFRVKNKELQLVGAISEPIAKREGMSGELEALRSIVQSKRFRGREVICSIRNDEVDTRPLSLPPGITPDNPEAFQESLMQEARTALSYDPSEAIIDYLPFESQILDGEERFSLLLVASSIDKVNRHLALLKASKLRAKHLDITLCALTRLLYKQDSTYCVINLDAESTEVSIGKHGNLLFSRTLRLGSNQMKRALMKALNVSEADAQYLLRQYGCGGYRSVPTKYADIAETGKLDPQVMASTVFEICNRLFDTFATEVKRSIDYFVRQHGRSPVEETKIFGSCLPGNVESFLRDRLTMPTTELDVFKRLGLKAQIDSTRKDTYAIAAGLALRGVVL